jgi:hypothetical protein
MAMGQNAVEIFSILYVSFAAFASAWVIVHLASKLIKESRGSGSVAMLNMTN